MSHSFTAEGGTIFNFNSDFSGNVRIIKPVTGEEILVPGLDLIELVALAYVVREKISLIENMGVDEVLGIKGFK